MINCILSFLAQQQRKKEREETEKESKNKIHFLLALTLSRLHTYDLLIFTIFVKKKNAFPL